MSASYPIRPISITELPEFMRVGEHAFNSNWPTEPFIEFERPVFEPERSLAAFDRDEIVGTATVMSFGMTVPGGEVSAAGVTGVSVLPSHRRQGVLSSLMRRQLADIAAGPEPVAALIASESVIYGRYGYGSASTRLSYCFTRGDRLIDVPDDAPALRLAELRDVEDAIKSVFEAFRVTRPGVMSRRQEYWDGILDDPEWIREGNSPRRCLLAEDETGPRGYALYNTKPDFEPDGLPAGVLNVSEVFSLDQAATSAIWSNLLSRDLVASINAWNRPVDDPLLHLLNDPRRARATCRDGLWIRIIDLPEALTQRRYAAPVDLVIEVTDPFLPGNSGRWRFRTGGLADGGQPSCERTSGEADLAMPVAALGAGYLGGTRLGGLATAGVIAERRPGAVAALSAAMWWDPAPWAATSF
jgi:predicted acetyltransferase